MTRAVTDVCGFSVRCRKGTLWITSPEEPGDAVVTAGEQLSVTSRGTIMVGALIPSSMWVPEGFAVDDAERTPRRRMELRRLRPLTTRQRPAARASDEPCGPTTEMARLAPFQKFIMIISRILPKLTGTADARERYLSRSVDHADFENRVRTWDAHEARLRCLPPVL